MIYPFFKDLFWGLFCVCVCVCVCVCTIFKVFLEFVATLFLFYVLVLWP